MAASVRAVFPVGTGDSFTSSGTAVSTASVAVVASDVLEVHVTWDNSSDAGVTLSCKLDPGGANLSPDGQSTIIHSNNQTAGFEQVFYYKTPPVGTWTVTTTASATAAIIQQKVRAFAGTDNGTPTITTFAPAGTGTSTAVTITSPSVLNGIVSFSHTGGTAFSSTSATNNTLANNGGAGAAQSLAGSTAPGTGSNVVGTGTMSGADWSASTALSWSPAGGVVEVRTPTYRGSKAWRRRNRHRQILPMLAPSTVTAVTPSTRATQWDTLASVTATRATTWAVNAQVQQTKATTYAVLAQVTASTRATSWTVLSAVTASTRATQWAVNAQVAQTKATQWAVLGQVQGTRATTWNTLAWVIATVVNVISDSEFTAMSRTVVSSTPVGNFTPYWSGQWARFTDVTIGRDVVKVVAPDMLHPHGIQIGETPNGVLTPSARYPRPLIVTGDTWTASCWFKGDAGVQYSLGVRATANSDASGSNAEYGSTITATGAWQFVSAPLTIGAGGNGFYANFQIHFLSNPTSNGQTFYLYDQQVNKGTLAPYQLTDIYGGSPANRATTWAVLSQVTAATRATTWAVLSQVTPATRATQWAVSGAVQGTRATTWTVFAQVAQTKATTWTVNAQVQGTRATTWATLAQVQQTKATQWAVLSTLTQVAQTKATTWAVNAQVSSTRATTWAVNAQVQQTKATTWVVFAQVASTRATIWAVRANVTGTRATTWTVLAIVTPSTRSTQWAVAGTTTPVTPSTRATTWTVLAIVQGSRATQWAVLSNFVLSTPARRTMVIPARSNTLVVPADPRILTAPAASRAGAVPDAQRVLNIPEADRTVPL